ncbi:histidine kinase [Microbacterium aurum]
MLAGWEVTALVSGDTDDDRQLHRPARADGDGAAALAAFAVAVARGGSWGRSGGIVAQLLLLAVAFGAFTGPTAGRPAVGIALTVPALVGLGLLIGAARAAARRAE